MLTCKHILFPVDFSEQCAWAAPAVTAMARRLNARVTLLHVISLPQAAPAMAAVVPDAPYVAPFDLDLLRSERAGMFQRFATDHFDNAATRQLTEDFDAASAIVGYAESNGVDLIMMPTHGYGRFRRLLLGSVTAKVLHDAECPVWTNAHTNEPGPAARPISGIVCAVDLKKPTLPLLRWAGDFAAAVNAPLHAVAVETAAEAYFEGTPYQEPVLEAANDALGRALRDAGVRNATSTVESGRIATAINKTVKSKAADLLIIGRGRLTETLGRLRSHAYQIIRESPCPVVSV